MYSIDTPEGLPRGVDRTSAEDHERDSTLPHEFCVAFWDVGVDVGHMTHQLHLTLPTSISLMANTVRIASAKIALRIARTYINATSTSRRQMGAGTTDEDSLEQMPASHPDLDGWVGTPSEEPLEQLYCAQSGVVRPLAGAGRLVDHVRSPNHESREGTRPSWIVLGYSSSPSRDESLQQIESQQSGGSCHVLVSGTHVTQCVPLDRAACSIGRGALPEGDERRASLTVDRSAIAIDVVNAGHILEKDEEPVYCVGRGFRNYDVDKYPAVVWAKQEYDSEYAVNGFWETYSDEDYRTTAQVCAALVEAYDIPITHIVGRCDVKVPVGADHAPGPAWDWDIFHGYLAALLGEANKAPVLNLRRTRT